MSSVALNAISITVGLFFVFFGTLKLCPLFSEDLYRDMRKLFITSAQAFPGQSITGWKPNAHSYRRLYGVIETISGLLMMCCPGILKDISNVALLSLMLSNLYVVWVLGQGLKEASHGMVFGLLLLCRLIIRLQVYQKERDLENEAEKLMQEHLEASNRYRSSDNHLGSS